MATMLRNCFCHKSKNKDVTVEQEYKIDLKEYEATYDIPKVYLGVAGIRLMRNDSSVVKFLWLVYYWSEYVNVFVATVLEVISMGQVAQGGTFENAVSIFLMMPCVGCLIMAITKSSKIVQHRPVFENLVNELRDMWPKDSITKEEYNIITTSVKRLNMIVRGYYWCNNILGIIFLVPPIAIYFQWLAGYDVDLVLPFFYWLPFDPYERINFEIMLVLQTWHSVITITFMVVGDMLLCIFLCHITVQFDILAARIRKFAYVPIDQQLIDEYPLGDYIKEFVKNEKRTIETFNNENWENRHRKELTEIVLRHQTLIRLAGDVEEMFSFALLLNFVNSSVIICFCGFCCVIVEKWNEVAYKIFLMTALVQTWLLCWYGHKLVESSRGVADAIYNSGWYGVDKKITNFLLIMIHRAQKDVHITTYGFSVISLATYTTIIKTSWSYFTLLLNVYRK